MNLLFGLLYLQACFNWNNKPFFIAGMLKQFHWPILTPTLQIKSMLLNNKGSVFFNVWIKFKKNKKTPQHDPKIICKRAGNVPQKMQPQQSFMFLKQITDGEGKL